MPSTAGRDAAGAGDVTALEECAAEGRAWPEHRLDAAPPARPAAVDDYRGLMSAFPTGVAIVTSIGEDGRPCGMTCSSLSSVTLEPPTLSVCLRHGSATLAGVRGHGRFAVNLLDASGRRSAELFASPVADRFSLVRWRASRTGLPWLDRDAFALAECEVAGTVAVGDHSIVLGHVVGVTLRDGTPLLYGRRQFSAWCAGGHEDDGPGARA